MGDLDDIQAAFTRLREWAEENANSSAPISNLTLIRRVNPVSDWKKDIYKYLTLPANRTSTEKFFTDKANQQNRCGCF